MTERTVPNSLAATPDSNDPISFDEPMKIRLTADTRPNRCGGVRRVSKVERITTLTLSTIPLVSSSASDNQNQCDSANRIQQTPKIATQMNSVIPVLRSLRWTSNSEIRTAPAAGAERSIPNPCGPTWSISDENMGSSARAPPNNTENK